MSWSTVAAVSSTFTRTGTVPNGYVDVGYVIDSHIQEQSIWADVAAASGTWTAA
jgi:hypothetical protein